MEEFVNRRIAEEYPIMMLDGIAVGKMTVIATMGIGCDGRKRMLRQDESTLNRQFEGFAGFYDFKPILYRPYRGHTKGKIKRTVLFVRDNFFVGINYDSLDNLNFRLVMI